MVEVPWQLLGPVVGLVPLIAVAVAVAWVRLRREPPLTSRLV
ncbi:hypothetical protein [Ornithinimicrobium sp. Y1694]